MVDDEMPDIMNLADIMEAYQGRGVIGHIEDIERRIGRTQGQVDRMEASIDEQLAKIWEATAAIRSKCGGDKG